MRKALERLFVETERYLFNESQLYVFVLFRGMPVACHGKFSGEFLFHRRRKTANLIDSWNYFYFQTICDQSRKDCNFHNFCDSGKDHFANLRFWQGEEIYLNRRLEILEGISTLCIELNIICSVLRTGIEFTVQWACQMNQRVQAPNLRVHPANVPNCVVSTLTRCF